MAIVRESVKPFRDKNPSRQRRELWWRFTRPAPEMYRAIKSLDRVLVIALVSKTVAPAFVSNGIVFAHKLGVFAHEEDELLGLLQRVSLVVGGYSLFHAKGGC
jgi:hypothetical protein